MKHKTLLSAFLVFALTFAGCTTGWVSTATADAPIVIQIVTGIIQIVSSVNGKAATPQEISRIQAIGNVVVADMSLAQVLAQKYDSTPSADRATLLGKIHDALVLASANLNQLLQAAAVTNPNTRATIAGAVNLALATVSGLESLIPAPATTTLKAAAPHVLLAPAVITARYNAILKAHGFQKYSLR